MPVPKGPNVIVFDVNETLLDLTTLVPVFDRIFGKAEKMREWFAQLILYSQAMTLSGLYAPFGELASATLRMIGETSGVHIADDDVHDLMHGVQSMPVLPDVVPALGPTSSGRLPSSDAHELRTGHLSNTARKSGDFDLLRAQLQRPRGRALQARAGMLRYGRQRPRRTSVRSLHRGLPPVGHNWRPGGRMSGGADKATRQCSSSRAKRAPTGYCRGRHARLCRRGNREMGTYQRCLKHGRYHQLAVVWNSSNYEQSLPGQLDVCFRVKAKLTSMADSGRVVIAASGPIPIEPKMNRTA